ncbi:hypothetical protein Dimus_034849 [Dionaea muscipula]
MQTLPISNLIGFHTRRPTFHRRAFSPLNPSANAAATAQFCSSAPSPQSFNPTTERTRTHLANLEKLLQKHTAMAPVVRQESPTNTRGQNRAARANIILEGLSLPQIWAAVAEKKSAAEEMSPRHLNRLQRLLSKSQEYSPRDQIGSRWREYHGSNDWAGLLDPLDPNLRREVIRYGEFVQAAYQAFHSNPSTTSAAGEALSLPDKSYKVTKSLYATSSIGLPRWVDDVAPDLGWMTQRSSWIGYVAVCDDKREIIRMGRRDIVIALRGTSTCLEWAENLRDVLVPMPGSAPAVDGQQPKVECGFSSLFTTPMENVPSLAESVVQEVRRLMKLYDGETLSISVTGHSLGAALALLVADELTTTTTTSTCSEVPPVAVMSFGGPRVGNRAFANRINNNGVKVLRIVNEQDVITRVPGMFVNEELDEKLRADGMIAGVLDVLDNNMPWAYTHVGTELKVDTKKSPYLRPDADVACCHDLEAYLHLVDGFMASNCPFRANAKRSLLKLLSEQGANVKKLYMANCHGLKPNSVEDNHNMKKMMMMPAAANSFKMPLESHSRVSKSSQRID